MDEDDDNKQVKRVNFAEGDDDDDTGEEFLFEKEEDDEPQVTEETQVKETPVVIKSIVRKPVAVEDEDEEEELSDMDKIRHLHGILFASNVFDEEDVAILASQKAQLLKAEVKKRTFTKSLARDHFQSTIDEREKVLTDAVRQGLLVPGSETFLFYVKKQAKLVDLAQKLY